VSPQQWTKACEEATLTCMGAAPGISSRGVQEGLRLRPLLAAGRSVERTGQARAGERGTW
jgi:hypothetical protein